MAEVKWTSQAESDLEEISFYIASKDNRPKTADRVIDEIREATELYASQPEMGAIANELDTEFRIIPHKRWVIIYEPVKSGILIRAVVDVARDYPTWRP